MKRSIEVLTVLLPMLFPVVRAEAASVRNGAKSVAASCPDSSPVIDGVLDEPCWAIAEALAQRGVATLRFDESGVGESTGPWTEHFKQRVTHVAAALDALRNCPELTGVPEQTVRQGAFDGFIERMASVEMQVFLSYDPVPAFMGVRVPVLLVWGSIDKQTSPTLNEPPLKAASHRDAKLSTVILPDEDHFFLRGQDLPPGKHEYGRMSVSPALFDTIGRWLDKTFGEKGSKRPA